MEYAVEDVVMNGPVSRTVSSKGWRAIYITSVCTPLSQFMAPAFIILLPYSTLLFPHPFRSVR
jgi:hypothetical protein